ncbi:M16 family metallopeptidase [Candidatus Omnitrophota bacterium]
MSKILKLAFIYILAFFILDTLILSKLSNAQEVKTLENGLRLIVKEDHRNPIVVFSAFIDVGSASEGMYLGSGLSHLTEHMLFKGTEKYPPGSIEDILHTYGGKIDGFTSYDYTGYRITILKEHASIALDVLKEILTDPTFDLEELRKEKDVIEKEMNLSKDDPRKRISRLTFSNAYFRHPYRIPIIGYRENFQRLERDDLVEFFHSNYVPEKTIIAIVGDIDKDVVLTEIDALFGEIPRGNNALVDIHKEPEHTVEIYREEKIGIDGAYLNIAFHSTSLLDRDLYALDILSFILGQGESSRLNEEMRIKKELVVAITSYNYTPKEAGLFVISSVLKEENVKEAADEIIKEIDIIKRKGVSEEELIKAKNNFLADYTYQKETIQSKANDLALGELLAGNPRFFESYIARIQSVTLEEIQEAANRYLKRSSMTVAVLSKSGEALGRISESPVRKEERSIEKITLKNGLSVLISRDPSLPIVSMTLLFKGGLRYETIENNGISRILSRMFMDGMDSMTREEIARFYESKGISVNTYSQNNSLGISVDCLKEHTEVSLELISRLSLDSVFPEKELDREKNETRSLIEMQDNQIFNHGHRLLKESLFKTHPYGFQTIGTAEGIDKIKREDVLDFRKGMLSTDNVVLGISGDCDVEEIKILVDRYFSGLPSKKTNTLLPEKERPMDKVRRVSIETDKEQSLVLFGFHGIDVYDKDRYAVEVMTDSLSSESGIIFKNIREKNGLSYATGAFQVLGLDPGYIVIYALTSKEKIETIKDIISREIASFIKDGVSLDELEKSKNHLKAMRRIALQTNSSFIFTSSIDELYGLGYNNYKDYDKNIDSVVIGDIKRAAKEILTLEECAIVILTGKE